MFVNPDPDIMNTFIGKIRIGSLLILCIMYIHPLTAQDLKLLKGRVIDQSNSESVPFATVVIEGEDYGVVTNEDGSFTMPWQKVSQHDTLIISSLGYVNVKLAVSSFLNEDIYIVQLPPQSYSIDDVIVKGKRTRLMPARKMIAKAVSMLDNNYPTEPFLTDAYYRDYLKSESKYINLYEAHVKIEDMGFDSDDYKTSNIILVEGGLNPDFKIDKTIRSGYGNQKTKRIPNGILRYKGGNELAILRLVDPLRNRDYKTIDYINNIRTDFCDNHKFWHEGLIYNDGRPVYKLGFRTFTDNIDVNSTMTGSYANLVTNNNKVLASANGEVYIDAETYTILKIIYQANVSDYLHGDYKIWELAVEYKIINDITQLSYLSYNNAVEFPDLSDDSYFYLKNISFNMIKERVEFEFNNYPAISTGDDPGLFKMEFNGELVEFESIEVEGKLVYLYTRNDYLNTFHNKRITDSSDIEVNIKRLKDTRGNTYGKYDFKRAYQYRELFVRDINFDYVPYESGVILNKIEPMINFHDSIDFNMSREYFNSPLKGNF